MRHLATCAARKTRILGTDSIEPLVISETCALRAKPIGRSPSRRDGQQPPGSPCDQHAGAAPDSERHGLRQQVDDSESTGAAALARDADTPRLRRADPADLGAREPVWSV